MEIREFGYGSKAYELGDGERRANDNLRRFVERHVVPRSPWVPGEKVQSLAGGEVWWENRDGKMVIMPQEIQVASVSGRAENGEVWVLEGVLGK